ncbi:hypothetical protein BA190_27505 [Labrys sp. WJW]|uniref:hypothetical protein n=1 Tax=Labrys sp. WJW TaxID=1737983 RepID=UPI000834DF96|nr:hypothetical protein [Labrys sp. WJW]OCC01711.1 hypothetical protein BA190_27505 [Labrys sp. WJW]
MLIPVLVLQYLIVPLCAALNHMRGGGAWLGLSAEIGKLPGRPIFYAAPLLGGLAGPLIGWIHALVLAGCYLLWGIPEWGRWYSLNRESRSISGKPGWWAAILERYADRIPLGQIIDAETGAARNDYACFTIRNTALLLPLIAISPWLILLGPLQTAVYELGHRLRHPGGIAPSELMFGAVIGAAVLFLSL